MALGIDDILQITDFQTFLGQQVLNVYFYRCLAIPDVELTPNPYDAFLFTFRSQVINQLRDYQHSGLVHQVTVIKNLSNGIDIREDANPAPGLEGGDAEPSFTALGIRLVRTTAVTRHGSKRLGGMPESSFIGNTVNLAPAALTDIEFAFKSSLVDQDGVTDIGQPVIIGRTNVGTIEAPEYELDLLKINVVADAQVIRVTTQNTRKAGRGS